MKLYTVAHSVYKTQYRMVWVTRYRRKILVEGVTKRLWAKLLEVRKYYPEPRPYWRGALSEGTDAMIVSSTMVPQLSCIPTWPDTLGAAQ